MTDSSPLSDVPSNLSDISLSPPGSPPRSSPRSPPRSPPRQQTKLGPTTRVPSTSILNPLSGSLRSLVTPSAAPNQLSNIRTSLPPSIASPSPPGRHLLHFQAEMHIPQPGPPTRKNETWNWPHGVLSGGMLIDILECLSATIEPRDWSMTLWLQDHFIAPFGRVERLDGLIVQYPRDMDMLILAHSRYLEIVEDAARIQRLWIPGLEPKYQVSADRDPPQVPPMPRRFGRKVWTASEMYYRNGVETKRKGWDMGMCKDGMGWERHLRLAGEKSGSGN